MFLIRVGPLTGRVRRWHETRFDSELEDGSRKDAKIRQAAKTPLRSSLKGTLSVGHQLRRVVHSSLSANLDEVPSRGNNGRLTGEYGSTRSQRCDSDGTARRQSTSRPSASVPGVSVEDSRTTAAAGLLDQTYPHARSRLAVCVRDGDEHTRIATRSR